MTRILKALVATLALLALVVGPPAFLILAIGNPWPPQSVSLMAPLSDEAIIGVLAVLLWIFWAQMVISFTVEAWAAVRDRSVDVRLPVFGVQQDLARLLIGAIITSAVAAPLSAGLASPAGAATTASSTAEPGQAVQIADQAQGWTRATDRDSQDGRDNRDQAGQQAAPGDERVAGTKAAKQAPSITVTVDRGETLWSLAEQYLDDGDRWPEIAAANTGKKMTDGRTFNAADSIRPGWHLLIPGAHTSEVSGGEEGTYQVRAGDTLSQIAQDELGDAERYPELYEASRHITQPGGQRLTDPDHIEPGWTVATDRNTAASAASTPSPATPEPGAGSDSDPGSMELVPEPTVDVEAAPRHGEKPKVSESEPAPHSEPGEAAGEAAGQGADALAEPSAAADEGAEVDDADVLDAEWVLAGLAGGGVLLAGALYLGLQRRRRAQFRARRPGRAIAAPSPDLGSTERTITALGARAATTVSFLHQALGHLGKHARVNNLPMPPLAAAQVQPESVTLHLSAPAALPAPWAGTPDNLHWSCAKTDGMSQSGGTTGWSEAPYPMLLTVGVDRSGDIWMLNCEELGHLEITGDPVRGKDFARHLIAQLGANPWSELVAVDCISFDDEGVTPGERTRFHRPGAEGNEVVAEVLAGAVAMIDRAQTHDTDVATARVAGADDEVWAGRVLFLTNPEPGTEPFTVDDDTAERDLTQLRELIVTHPGRTGTAIVVTAPAEGQQNRQNPQELRVESPASDDDSGSSATRIRMTSNGRVQLDRQGLDLAAVGMSSHDAGTCAMLFDQAANKEDVEVPVDEQAIEGWEFLVDQTGALRREYTVPRQTRSEDMAEPATSLLERKDQEYVEAAAVVAADLDAVAPKVPDSVLEQVRAEDPDLGADLADWFDSECPRPKLTLLGPVSVRTQGRPLGNYKALCTEIVAFLALRPRLGATRDELADALGWGGESQKGKVRKYIDLTRHWLGEPPRTPVRYLPHVSEAPATKERGVNVYQVSAGLLTDWDLFRRLRARGTHNDLVQALELVAGRPFDHRREGGWSWLQDGQRHDHVAEGAVADVAFTVVTHCLREGDLVRARAATEIAILAVPEQQVVQLCQVALIEAEGDTEEALRILREDVCNGAEDGAGPLDLPERTREIIRNHQWIAS